MCGMIPLLLQRHATINTMKIHNVEPSWLLGFPVLSICANDAQSPVTHSRSNRRSFSTPSALEVCAQPAPHRLLGLQKKEAAESRSSMTALPQIEDRDGGVH